MILHVDERITYIAQLYVDFLRRRHDLTEVLPTATIRSAGLSFVRVFGRLRCLDLRHRGVADAALRCSRRRERVKACPGVPCLLRKTDRMRSPSVCSLSTILHGAGKALYVEVVLSSDTYSFEIGFPRLAAFSFATFVEFLPQTTSKSVF